MPAPIPGLRRLDRRDAEALLALVEACDIADVGEPDYTIDDVEDDLSRPGWRGWAAPDGRGGLTAYCWWERVGVRDTVALDARVHPEEPDPSLLPRLLAFVREQAFDAHPRLPTRMFTAGSAATARAAVEGCGGTQVRHYWRMAVDLPQEPPPPTLPPGVAIEVAGADDAVRREVHHVIETAFLDHFGHGAVAPYDEWSSRQLAGSGADPSLWWLLRVDGVPAAALVARAWPQEGYVQGLGTLRAFRGRGLARLLLQLSFAEFHRRGYRRASLSVDAANPTGAVALYESVGMSVAHEAVLYEMPPLSPPSIGPSPAGSTRSDSKNV